MADDNPPHIPEPADGYTPNPHRWIGRAISFDDPAGGIPPRRLVGIVDAARYVGRTKRGAIPDYELTIRGQSGKTVTVSLVESYATFPE